MGRTTDGYERTSRNIHDPRAEQIHSNCSSIWWTLYWGSVSAGGFHGSYWIRNWNLVGRHNHLPIFRVLCQGTIRDGQHGRPSLLRLKLSRNIYGVTEINKKELFVRARYFPVSHNTTNMLSMYQYNSS